MDDDYKLSAKQYISNQKIVEIIRTALINNQALSLVRIGDGENIVLAQEHVKSLSWIQKNVPWKDRVRYCGVTLPNLEARDRCIEAVKNADLVGVFAGDKLTEKIFSFYQIKPKQIFYAFNNVYLPMYKPFVQLMIDYPPLLVGKPAERFAAHLQQKLGIEVPWLAGVRSYEEVDRCIEQMAKTPHQWSLISAGVNSLIIADRMRTVYGKIAIDFGHAPDNVLAPKYKHYWLAIPEAKRSEGT